jgi:hypothetical protein
MRLASRPAARLLLFQDIDQFDRGVEAYALAVPRDGFDAEGALALLIVTA